MKVDRDSSRRAVCIFCRVEVRTAAGFLDYWEKVRERTRRVVAVIPAEHLEWTWKPGKFSPGDIVAASRRHRALDVRRERSRAGPPATRATAPELAAGLEEVKAYLERLHARGDGDLPAPDDADLLKSARLRAARRSAIGKWLRLMVEHEIHHRGQLYLLLSMQGVATPPIYGLTSEEVRARSLPPAREAGADADPRAERPTGARRGVPR